MPRQLDLPFEQIARAIHDRYQRRFQVDAAAPAWDELSDDDRAQSRSQAEDIPRKLGTVNRSIQKSITMWQFDDEEVENLARAEHRRWSEVQIERGYQYGANRNDHAPKTHPDLVPWEQLDKVAKDKDRSAVRAIPELLLEFGLSTLPATLTVRIGVVAHENLTDQTKVENALDQIRSEVKKSVAHPNSGGARLVQFEVVTMDWSRGADLVVVGPNLDSPWSRGHLVRHRPLRLPASTPPATTVATDIEMVLVEQSSSALQIIDARSHITVESEAAPNEQPKVADHGRPEVLEVAVGVYDDPKETWFRLAQEVADRSDIILEVSPRTGLRRRVNAAVPVGAHRIQRYVRLRRFRTYELQPDTGRLLRKPRHKADYEFYVKERVQPTTNSSAAPTQLSASAGRGFREYAARLDSHFEPWIERADTLAAKHKRGYFVAGAIVLFAAALALAVFAFRTIFVPQHDWPRVLELGALVLAAGLQLTSTRRGWSRRWITYRGLAERLRSAKFLALAGHLSPTHQAARQETGTEPWVAAEAWRIWDSWTARRIDRDGLSTRDVLNHLREDWACRQLIHHRERINQCGRREDQLRRTVVLATLATLTLLALSLAGAFEDFHTDAFEFITFCIPVGVGVYAGIGEQREWRHYIARSRRTARELELLIGELDDLASAPDDNDSSRSIHALALQIDKAVRHDLKDWFWSMELSEIHAD